MVWYHELKTRLNSRVQFSPGPSPTDADVTAALKYEKQLLKIRLHQFQLEFSESHNGKRPSSKEDFGESIYREYRRYKELRVMLKDDSA